MVNLYYCDEPVKLVSDEYFETSFTPTIFAKYKYSIRYDNGDMYFVVSISNEDMESFNIQKGEYDVVYNNEHEHHIIVDPLQVFKSNQMVDFDIYVED